METLLPVGVAAAAITLTYFMCIRPMRHGNCAMMPGRAAGQQCDSAANAPEAEIAQLRAEIADLRRAQGLDVPEAPSVDAHAQAGLQTSPTLKRG